MNFPGGITGAKGVVKWSYYPAAAIEGYRLTVTPAARTWALGGRVVLCDRFKLKQRPLTFEARIGRTVCWWPIEDYAIVEGWLTARLGRADWEEQIWTRVLSGQMSAR